MINRKDNPLNIKILWNAKNGAVFEMAEVGMPKEDNLMLGD